MGMGFECGMNLGQMQVDAFDTYNGTLPVLDTVTGREQYTVPSNYSGPDPTDFSGVGGVPDVCVCVCVSVCLSVCVFVCVPLFVCAGQM